MARTEPGTAPWFPNVCTKGRALTFLVAGQLAVLLVSLAPVGHASVGAREVISASGFSAWLSVLVVILLCQLRHRISSLSRASGSLVSVLLVGGVTALAAWVLYTLYWVIGSPMTMRGPWAFCLGIAAISMLLTGTLLRYFYVSDRWMAQLHASAQATADALQARIRPHFLFNSMNLIASLIRSNPQRAEQAVLDLSDLFRAALEAGSVESTLAQEVELAKSYLAIESLRFGARLEQQWIFEGEIPWTQGLPRLVLQPLVENAVVHGISRMSAGGSIEIRIEASATELRIEVTNPVPVEAVPAVAFPAAAGSGHAVRNVAYRLAHRFGPAARLSSGMEGDRYVCRVHVPMAAGPGC